MHMLWLHIYTAWLFLCLLPEPLCPFCYPLSFPFVLPFTYLAPSRCDRNCPPSYQVACRLTPFAPPFTRSTHPFQIPRTPIVQRLTTTTLGPLRFHYAEQYQSRDGWISRWFWVVALIQLSQIIAGFSLGGPGHGCHSSVVFLALVKLGVPGHGCRSSFVFQALARGPRL
jgi:hypothetical protein